MYYSWVWKSTAFPTAQWNYTMKNCLCTMRQWLSPPLWS